MAKGKNIVFVQVVQGQNIETKNVEVVNEINKKHLELIVGGVHMSEVKHESVASKGENYWHEEKPSNATKKAGK